MLALPLELILLRDVVEAYVGPLLPACDPTLSVHMAPWASQSVSKELMKPSKRLNSAQHAVGPFN